MVLRPWRWAGQIVHCEIFFDFSGLLGAARTSESQPVVTAAVCADKYLEADEVPAAGCEPHSRSLGRASCRSGHCVKLCLGCPAALAKRRLCFSDVMMQ